MNKSKVIQVSGNSYKIDFPNVGKFIDIQVLETRLSQGQAKNLIFGTGDQIDAFLYITTYAHFSVLCPEMFKDLKVNSILDLSFEEYEQLVQIYLKEIQPWIRGVKDAIKEKIASMTPANDQ